jgi:hypothetical protein
MDKEAKSRPQMDFSQALVEVRLGRRMARTGWNGKGMYIEWVNGHTQAGVTFEPFLLLRTVHGTYIPWLASQDDLLAMDWEPV